LQRLERRGDNRNRSICVNQHSASARKLDNNRGRNPEQASIRAGCTASETIAGTKVVSDCVGLTSRRHL
jgi:hypothetical protein